MKQLTKKAFGEYKIALHSSSKDVRLFIFGNLLFGIGVNLIGLLFNLYCKSLSFTESAIGKLLSSRAFGSALVTLPAAFLLSRINLRYLFTIVPIFTGFFYIAIALNNNFSILVSLTLLTGAFSTFFSVAAGPFIMNNTKVEYQMHFFSLNGAIGMLTGVIGNIIGGFFRDITLYFVKNELLSYKLSIGFGALIILFSTFVFSRIKYVKIERSSNKAIFSVSNWKIYLKLLFPALFIGIGAGLTIPYINLYFKIVFNMSDSLIGIIYGISQFFTFLGIMLGPILARSLGKPITIVLTQAISIPFILILTYIKNPIFVVLAFFIRGTLMNMASPLSDNFALENVPKAEQSLMNALKMFVWTSSWMISARISGSTIESKGFAYSFTLTAIMYAISTLFFSIFFIKTPKKSVDKI